MNLRIERKLLQLMHNHAINTYPEECCGFMFGADSRDDIRKIAAVKEAENVKTKNRERRFEIDPLEYLRAEKYAEKNGINLIGIYHSHPNHPARPSKHDLAQAAPSFSYLIMSVSKTGIENTTSWRLDVNNQFEEETLLIDQKVIE